MGAESVLTNIQSTATGVLAPEMKTFYERNLLERLLPNLVYAQFGQKRSIKKNNGKIIEFRRFDTLTPGSGYTNNQFQLSEGVTPGGQNLAMSTVTATVTQHGSFIALTDVLELVAYDQVLDETSELLGEQSGEYIDTLVREVLMAGTNVLYALPIKFTTDSEIVRDTAGTVVASRITVTKLHAMSVDTIRTGKRIMQRNKVKPYKGEKDGPAGRGEFVMVVHPDAIFDIEGNKKWIDVKKYKDTEASYTGEAGMIYGVRLVMSENAKVFTAAGAAGVDVYGALMLGKDAFGIVDVAGSGNVEFIFKPKGSGGTEDPLNQRQTSAWKVMFTTVILQPLAMLRIEHGFQG